MDEKLAGECEIFKRILSWMNRNGFSVEKCRMEPRIFPSTGRGLAATHTISAGEAIIEVPSSLIITSRTVMDSYLRRHIIRQKLTPLAAICIFLVCERLRGLLSPWHDYISSLPSTYTVPLYWSHDLIQRLPTAIKQTTLDQRKIVQGLFNQVKPVFTSLSEEYSEFRGHSLDMNSFIWAWSTVNTRCVYWIQKDDPHLKKDGEDHYALVPYLDLLNHSHTAQVVAGFNEQTSTYRILSQTECNQDDQVFICYGPHSNVKLLLEYGFMLEKNINNVIHVTSDEFNIAVGENCESLALIAKNQLHRGHALSEEGITWSLQTALKVAALQHMEEKPLSRWRECLEDDHYISTEHQVVTDGLLNKLLDNQLQRWQFEAEQNGCDDLEQMIFRLCQQHQHLVEKCRPDTQL